MKLFVGVAIFLWLLCGFIAAMWLHNMSGKNIVRGPISLAKAYNENPASYPGP